jgi:hypothetical protein
MLHLTGEDGVPIAVGDGLGVPVDQWQVDDVIVQRHRLVIPQDTSPAAYRLIGGAYWLDGVMRLSTADGADLIPLATIEVER